MAITAERLEVDVQADTSSAKRELDSFSRHTESTAKSTGKAGVAATGMGRKFSAAAAMVKAAAGTMIAAAAGKTIMAASDLNEVLSKTGVVFGPQADMVTNAAQDMADKFGISKAVFLDAASGIGLVGKASGLTKKAAAGMSTEMAQLAADASSFYDVPVTEALDAMKSGLVGESEPMRRFGVLLSENAVKAEAARLGIADLGAELTEGQKVQARSSLIMRGMSDASGDLERTQSSVANRLREIRGRLTNFAADMGTKALPAAEAFLTALVKAPKVIGNVASSIRDYVTTNATFKPVMDLVKAAISGVVAAVKAIPQVFSTVKAAIQGFIQENQWLVPILDQVAVAAGAFVAAFLAVIAVQKVIAVIKGITLAIKAMSLAMMANPVGLIIAGLVALGVALYAAYQRFEPFRNLVNTVASALRNALGTAVQWVTQKWREIAPVVTQVLNVLKSVVVGYIRFMVPIWKAGFQAIWNIVKTVFNTIKGVVKGALNVIKGIVNVVMGVIRGDWGRVWKGIQQIVSGVWGVIKSLVSGAIGVVKGVITGGLGVIKAAWSSAWNAMKGLLGQVWGGIKSGVQNGISAVMGFISSLPGKITGVFAGAGSWLLGAGKAILQGLWDGIDSMVGSIKDKLGSVTNLIPDWKGPYEKDLKLLRKNGRAIIKGLIDGFQDNFPKVKRYLGRLTNWVRDGFGGKMERRLVRRIKNTQGRLRKVLEREANITRRLRDQIAKRDELREAKANVIDATRQGISAQANVLNAGNNAGTIRQSLEAQVAKAREFAQNLKALAGKGYPKELIAQVAGAGVEGGAEVAKALLAANSADAGAIGQAFSEINQIAKSQSKALGNMLYNPGIQAANGLIEGLKRKRKNVEQVLVQIAKGMQKALRKALGIKSPSRVMAALARMIPEGIAKGIRERAGKANRAATVMARGVSSSVAAGLDTGPRPPGGPGGPGGLTPASLGVGTGGGGVHLEFKTYNPLPEPQSRTTNKALNRVSSLGLV